MKYRIHYSSHSSLGSKDDCSEEVELATDQTAVEEFERRKKEAYENRGKYAVARLYHWMERIDQEERTTRII